MLNYNAPIDGNESSIDGNDSTQVNTFFCLKKALVDAKKSQYFMPLANVKNMPKHFGKTIKLYHYIPLLDDRNVNDQGIDAQGVTMEDGNLYGSSKDICRITERLPTLTENGGRVNRVGFTRVLIEGSIHKFGMFYEFSQEALDFDSDDGLREHIATQLMNGAIQLTEAVLQKDLLNGAGTVLYPGAAASDDDITGEGDEPSLVTYEDFTRLDQVLTDNRTPKQTTIITGSRMIDTKTVPSTRVCYCGSELIPYFRTLKDPFGNPAFISVEKYGAATNVMNGEVGAIANFRIIEVPEMLHWAGVGSESTDENPGYRESGGNYNVYPILCVGDDSFSTIGFQTNGKSVKFNVMTKMPGKETADRNDPYGETGFSSLKYYYGVLIQRPERLGLIKTVAPV